jgi:hypothetical protein
LEAKGLNSSEKIDYFKSRFKVFKNWLKNFTSSSPDPALKPFFLSILGKFLTPAVFLGGPNFGSTFRALVVSGSVLGTRLFGEPDCKTFF